MPKAGWRRQANCLEVPKEVMYGPKDSKLPMSRRQVREARSLCYECPVRRDCLAFALVMDDAWGVWGGLTPAERGRALELTGADAHMDRVAGVMSIYDTGTLEEQVILKVVTNG